MGIEQGMIHGGKGGWLVGLIDRARGDRALVAVVASLAAVVAVSLAAVVAVSLNAVVAAVVAVSLSASLTQ